MPSGPSGSSERGRCRCWPVSWLLPALLSVYFGPDDAQLSTWPQLVKPVTKAKELILQLGNA